MRITKEFSFESAHQLPADKECTHGVCSRLHGHSYKIRVAVGGIMNADKWIMDFKELSAVVKRLIVDICDHRFLNDLYPNEVTTAENLGLIWSKQLHDEFVTNYPRVDFHSFEVWETAKCCAVIEASDIAGDQNS